MASKSDSYWSRSYALLTRDQGWIKPLLVLSAARMVPIVGPFGVDGYALEWARLTSWGVDSAPKQKGVDIGACIGSGARAFVVALGYLLVAGVVNGVLGAVLGALGSLLCLVISVAVGVLIIVAKLRATIYQSVGAGYQVNRIVDMVKRDTEGLLRIVGLSLVLGLVVGVIASILVSIVLLSNLGGIIHEIVEYEMYGYVDEYYVASMLLASLAGSLPALLVISYIIGIAGTFANLIKTTAVGLWMRQFDVQNWGQSADPLPGDAPFEPASSYDRPASAPTAQYADPQPASAAEPVDYTPAPAPVPMPVPTPTNDVAAPASSASTTAPEAVRTFSLSDETEDELANMQQTAAPDTVRVSEAPSYDTAGSTIPTAVVEEAQVPEMAADAATDQIEERQPAAPAPERTPEEVIEQAEAAIRAADMTKPAEEEDAPKTVRFSLDDAAEDEEEIPTATEEDFKEDLEDDSEDIRPESDEVITKTIRLGGGEDDEQAQ